MQFKGNFAHGWFGNQHDIKGAFLHHKSFYLQIGKQQFSVYGGLTHFAQWGGAFSSGQAPSRFKDYLRIIAARSGDATDSDKPPAVPYCFCYVRPGRSAQANKLCKHNNFSALPYYLCIQQADPHLYRTIVMKKRTAAISSLLVLGGLGSLSYLTAQVLDLNLFFDLLDEEEMHFC